MSKFHIALFAIILAVFFGIIVITEEGSLGDKSKAVPTLPPDASNFQLISPTVSQNMNRIQGQQAQAQQQQVAPTFGMAEEEKASISAVIKTSKGEIDITLFGKAAPKTVQNFVNKAKSGFYKGLIFHRVEDWVVQGGDPNGNGTGGGLMQTELNQLPFSRGSIGAAGIQAQNGQIVSNDSQFFITKKDASWLDQQYANFGVVTSGMDVVDSIKIGDKILGITILDSE